MKRVHYTSFFFFSEGRLDSCQTAVTQKIKQKQDRNLENSIRLLAWTELPACKLNQTFIFVFFSFFPFRFLEGILLSPRRKTWKDNGYSNQKGIGAEWRLAISPRGAGAKRWRRDDTLSTGCLSAVVTGRRH